MELVNHYKWLEKHLESFWQKVFNDSLQETGCAGIISAHGDKAYQYREQWEEQGIPFPHGVAVYFLTYTDLMKERPKHESCDWVVDNYDKYRQYLPEVDETDMDVICPFAKAQRDAALKDDWDTF